MDQLFEDTFQGSILGQDSISLCGESPQKLKPVGINVFDQTIDSNQTNNISMLKATPQRSHKYLFKK